MRLSQLASILISFPTLILLSTCLIYADNPPTFVDVPEKFQVEFKTPAEERHVPERFRLPTHTFQTDIKPWKTRGPVKVFKVTFPSPVTTETTVNNTVHGEYYLPAGDGPFPAVVVLHILGGEFPLSQVVANSLARKNVAALFIKMPYYGERRDPKIRRRMISREPKETVEGMTQAVLDIRHAAAWLRSRPEVDTSRLGITGISLGGIMSALSAPAEPTFQKVAIYLGGGNLAGILWELDHSEARTFRGQWEEQGGTRESFIQLMKPVDPVNYGHLLRNRDVLMVAARQDKVVPPAATKALHDSIGEQAELIWLDAGHVGSGKYLLSEIVRIQDFFTEWNQESPNQKTTVAE
ncbi:MAG: alpha/beta hydrolase family protein [Planctomycetaceae bacterium]|jgi:dienelactone hydrolase|nr:alpha/beta hydrolase family protein [Planctomycetaceae bacterium]